MTTFASVTKLTKNTLNESSENIVDLEKFKIDPSPNFDEDTNRRLKRAVKGDI